MSCCSVMGLRCGVFEMIVIFIALLHQASSALALPTARATSPSELTEEELCKLLGEQIKMDSRLNCYCHNECETELGKMYQRTSRSLDPPKVSAAPSFLRFGREASADLPKFSGGSAGTGPPNFLRFGKRGGLMVTRSLNKNNFLRFGRAGANFLRFGRNVADVNEWELVEKERFGRDSRDPNFLRFGR